MTDNALKCKFNGGTMPIGYVIDAEQHFQIDPLTAPFVLEAFKRYDGGETISSIMNWLNEHIQQGILTRSTKERLEELENRRDELENRLACEKLAKPKVSAEFMTFWLHRFRKLDVRQQSHRKMLIDAFINAIFLYDDKMVITFNYKEGTKTITFAELQEAISNKNGSDLDCLAAPKRKPLPAGGFLFLCLFFGCFRGKNGAQCIKFARP